MEAVIVAQFFASLLSRQPPHDENALPTALSEGPLPYILRPSTNFTSDSATEDAFIPLDLLKAKLADLSARRGWDDGLGQKAIYALVAKRLVRIDRKGKPLLCVC